MSLQISGFTYAPRIEEFARETSDEDPEQAENNPVARSTALRQAVELVEPDWIVVSETSGNAIATTQESTSADSLEFGEPDVDGLAEVIQILTNTRGEPVVPVIPDPVGLTLEIFGEEWTTLLGSDEFAALDVLHRASQVLSDVMRAFEGNSPGIVLDASWSSEIVDDNLLLDDYLLEVGPIFNVAEHHNVSVGGIFSQDSLSDFTTLRQEFDFVVFENIQPSEIEEFPSESFGCSFPDAFWDEPDTDSFQQKADDYLNAIPSDEVVLMQQISSDIKPEYVQILGEVIEDRR